MVPFLIRLTEVDRMLAVCQLLYLNRLTIDWIAKSHSNDNKKFIANCFSTLNVFQSAGKVNRRTLNNLSALKYN